MTCDCSCCSSCCPTRLLVASFSSQFRSFRASKNLTAFPHRYYFPRHTKFIQIKHVSTRHRWRTRRRSVCEKAQRSGGCFAQKNLGIFSPVVEVCVAVAAKDIWIFAGTSAFTKTSSSSKNTRERNIQISCYKSGIGISPGAVCRRLFYGEQLLRLYHGQLSLSCIDTSSDEQSISDVTMVVHLQSLPVLHQASVSKSQNSLRQKESTAYLLGATCHG